MKCPCGSGSSYEACCGKFHLGPDLPETAEQLMRSRYSAFVTKSIPYLKDSLWPKYQKDFDEVGFTDRAANSLWLGLTILKTTGGTIDDTKGTVTFTARSMVNGTPHTQTENSLFKKKAGRWYYVSEVR